MLTRLSSTPRHGVFLLSWASLCRALGRSFPLALGMAVGLLGLPTAKAADAPKVAVVVLKGKGAPNLKGPVKKLIEKPLGKGGNAQLISAKAFKKAARKAKVKGKALKSVDGSKKVAAAAGAQYLLVFESAMEKEPTGKKKRTKKVFYAAMTLIKLEGDEAVLEERYALKGKKLTKDLAKLALDALNPVFDAAAKPPPAPEPEPEPPPPPPAPDAPTGDGAQDGDATADAGTADPAASGDAAADGSEGGAGDAAGTDGAQAAAATDAAAADGEGTTGADAGADATADAGDAAAGGPAFLNAPPPVEETPKEEEAPPETMASGESMVGFRLQVGGLAARRTAVLTGDEGSQLPCYCTLTSTNELGKNPLFPKGTASLELYPLALGGTTGLLSGLGIHLDSTFTKVTTTLGTGGESRAIDSTVYAISGGPSVRLPFWSERYAPDLTVKLGVSYDIFPLAEGAFPGVRYTGLGYVGADLTFPIPSLAEVLAVQAGGRYTLVISPSGRTSELGTYESGSHWLVKGGIRFGVGALEGRIFASYEKYALNFVGPTTLAEASEQAGDDEAVLLEDTTLSFGGSIGVAF